MKEYVWVGSWTDPGRGEYVIMEDGRELEPYEVVNYIKRLHDLIEQIERIQDITAEVVP